MGASRVTIVTRVPLTWIIVIEKEMSLFPFWWSSARHLCLGTTPHLSLHSCGPVLWFPPLFPLDMVWQSCFPGNGTLSIFLSLTHADWWPPRVALRLEYIVSDENDHDIFSQKAPFPRTKAVYGIPFPSSCSYSLLCCLPKVDKPFHTLPQHSLWTLWTFLIQVKDSNLSNSIQLS